MTVKSGYSKLQQICPKLVSSRSYRPKKYKKLNFHGCKFMIDETNKNNISKKLQLQNFLIFN